MNLDLKKMQRFIKLILIQFFLKSKVYMNFIQQIVYILLYNS